MSARKRRGLALSWSALFVLSLLLQYFSFALAAPVGAVHADGLFELDGNAVNDSAVAGNDWDQVKAGTSAADSTRFIHDAVNSASDDSFTGGSTKDDIDTTSWLWKKAKASQAKNDITDAFAAGYTGTSGAVAGHSIVYFGLNKYDASGDNFVGFWFLQGSVAPTGSGAAPGSPFSGAHHVGDILVLADYTNGGDVSTFSVYSWVASGGNAGTHLQTVATGVPCTGAPAFDDACGVTNTNTETSPWSFTDKSGSSDFLPGELFEGGIDLTNLHLDQGCFTSFIAETRASQAVDATLSDFASGTFSFCVGADIATQVKQGSTSLGNNGHITIGESVTDVATLTGSKGTVTGTVDFSVCGPHSSAPDCTTGGTKVGATKTLSGGIATSDAFTPDAVGSYCFRVDYTAATGSKYLDGSHTNTTSECFVVDKKQPAISTSAAETVDAGNAISDSATLSGATSDAGGTITFTAYGPGTDCSTLVFTSSALPVSGNKSYGPVSFTPATAGTYHWIASYSGDAKNRAVAGSCGDSGENDIVNKVDPSISTTASGDVTIGASISDTATVSGGLNPSGNVTFKLYGPNDATCATVIFTSANRPLSGGSASSATFAPAAVGTYRWIATYNGDANNNSVSGTCTDANESVVVNKIQPAITTSLVSGALSGTTIAINLGDSAHDTSSLSNATADAGGTVHYQVFTNANCTGTAIDAGTKAVTDGVPADSDPVTFNTSGNYYWQADYSGDAKNLSASSNCSLEVVSVGLNKPTISTTASASVLVGGQIHDTATLAGGFDPQGTITFRLFGANDASCANGAIFTDVVDVNGNGNYDSGAFTANVAGTYRWVATYSGDDNNAAVAGACNDANESVIVTTPALHSVKLVKTNDGSFGPTSTATPGDVLTYQITVTNHGNGDALNVPVSDDISDILAHATYNGDCNLGCSFAADTLSWTIPSIAANGGSAVLTFSVTLDSTFPTGVTHLPNVVVVTGPGTNCAAASQDPDCDTDTTVATSVLSITKSLTAGNTGGTDPDLHVPAANIGDTLTFTLVYQGAGPLTHGIITDTVPDGLQFVTGSAHGNADFGDGAYDATTRTITWNASATDGALPDPANGTLTYQVKVLAAAAEGVQPLVNTATIDSAETEPVSDTASVAVLPPPLALTPPPTDTLVAQTSTGNPGFALMLILVGMAGLALGIGFITPVPERVRRRDQR